MVVEIFAQWIVIMIGQINLWIGRLIKFLADYTNQWQWAKKTRGEKKEDIIGIVANITLVIIGTTRVQGKIGTCPKKILRIQIFKTLTSFICPWWTTLGCMLQPQPRVEFFYFFFWVGPPRIFKLFLGGPSHSPQATSSQENYFNFFLELWDVIGYNYSWSSSCQQQLTGWTSYNGWQVIS